MATLCKGEVLPFTLCFVDKNEKEYNVEELWTSDADIKTEQMRVLRENAKIGVRFYSNDLAFDEHAVCFIQTNRYNARDEREVHKQALVINPKETHWIYKGESGEEFPWRMGIYLLSVEYMGKRYTGGIKVVPHHLDESQVQRVHEYLNSQIQGIIYDFIYTNKTPSEAIQANLPDYWYYDYARQVEENYDEFMFAMTGIEKNPSTSIETIYKAEAIVGKTDRKSFYLAIKTAKNSDINYNKKKQSHYNSKENMWIKNVLLVWEKDVVETEEQIKKDRNSLLRKLEQQELVKSRYKTEQTRMLFQGDIGENTKKDIKSRLSMANKDIEMTKKQLALLNRWIMLLVTMANKLVYFLNYTELVSVERGMRKPILKDIHYYRIDEIYELLKKIKDNTGERPQLTPILKPTWLIYEYFCLFKVLEKFKAAGYILVKGIDDKIINRYFEDKIEEGSKFELESDYKVVHVWYDHYHSHTPKDARERGELFYTHSPKKKPDIKIDVFDKVDGRVEFSHSIIMDSKFSKLNDIYKSSYINRTTEQLSGYYNFFYIGSGPCIKKVICLYAGDGSGDIEVEHEPITYINFHPSVDGDGQVIGDLELARIIEEL